MEKPATINAWIEEWCALYPANVEFNGRKLRSKPKDCLNKMIKFCKENPLYDKSAIFAATKLYLQEQEAKDWEYTKQAIYFISKIGQPSLLEQYCEKIKQNNKPPDPGIYAWGIVSQNDFI
jgi:hypothetical protein